MFFNIDEVLLVINIINLLVIFIYQSVFFDSLANGITY